MDKLKQVLGSQNFLVTFFSIILLAFSANNVEIDKTPQEIFDMLSGKNFGQIGAVLFLQFFTPILKIVKSLISKTFDWSFLKSTNFQTMVMTLVSIVMGVYLGEVLTGIVVGLFLQIMNLVFHLRSPVK